MLRTALLGTTPNSSPFEGRDHFYSLQAKAKTLSSTCPAARGTSTIFWRTSTCTAPAGPLFLDWIPHGSRGHVSTSSASSVRLATYPSLPSFSSATLGESRPGDPTGPSSASGRIAAAHPRRDDKRARRRRTARCETGALCSVSKCCWSRNTAAAAEHRGESRPHPRKPPRPTTRWWLRDLFDGCPPYTRLCCGASCFVRLLPCVRCLLHER